MCVTCPHHKDAVRDELQTQLNHIQALDKMTNTTSTQGGNKGYSKQRGPSYRGLHSTSTGRNFLGRTSKTSQQSNCALKNLNKHVQYNHFKMDTLQSVISLKTPNCFMASVDLKDVYYSVPIAVAHQKYLKFEWGGKLYQLHKN